MGISMVKSAQTVFFAFPLNGSSYEPLVAYPIDRHAKCHIFYSNPILRKKFLPQKELNFYETPNTQQSSNSDKTQQSLMKSLKP